MTKNILIASLLGLALSACGDNLDSTRADARPSSDAPPGTPDGPLPVDAVIPVPDAAAGSTVTMTAGPCPAMDHEITTVANTFRLDGAATPNPPLVFAVDDQIQITVAAAHNFVSSPATGEFAFDSGAFGNDVCLVFTAPITLADLVTYHCEMHVTMTGSIVVNP